MLETAAVLGVTRVSFDVLAAVSGRSEDELIRILRDLVARGLLVETEADAFSFRHALAREAIESDLLGRERRRLHQAALDALRDMGSDDFTAIAHHAYGAGQFDDMVEAAREGARRSLHSGSTYQALQLAELGLTEAGDDPELLDLASRAAWMSGLLPDARDLAVRSFERAERAGDLEAESAALRLICRLDHDVSDAAAAAQSTAALAKLVERARRRRRAGEGVCRPRRDVHAARRLRGRHRLGRSRRRRWRTSSACRRCGPTPRSSAAPRT